jgi:hypothetical protein
MSLGLQRIHTASSSNEDKRVGFNGRHDKVVGRAKREKRV